MLKCFSKRGTGGEYHELRRAKGEKTCTAIRAIRRRAEVSAPGPWGVVVYAGAHPYHLGARTRSKDWRPDLLLGKGLADAEKMLEEGKFKSAFKALHQHVRLVEEMEPEDGPVGKLVAPHVVALNRMAQSPGEDFSGVEQLLADIKAGLRKLLTEADLRNKGFL